MSARPYSTMLLLGAGLGCAQPAGSPVGTETGDASTAAGSSEGESSSDSSDSDSSSETTGDEVDECVASLYEDCWAMAEDALVACTQACACGDPDCAATCNQDHETAHWACVPDEVADMCSESFAWQVVSRCHDACELATTDCTCDANACNYGSYACASTCHGCPAIVEFTYAHADSCEITLPGPLDPVSVPYTVVQVGNQQYQLDNTAAETCDDPSNPGYIWIGDAYDHLLLCPTACESFANFGELIVEVGTPPCE